MYNPNFWGSPYAALPDAVRYKRVEAKKMNAANSFRGIVQRELTSNGPRRLQEGYGQRFHYEPEPPGSFNHVPGQLHNSNDAVSPMTYMLPVSSEAKLSQIASFIKDMHPEEALERLRGFLRQLIADESPDDGYMDWGTVRSGLIRQGRAFLDPNRPLSSIQYPEHTGTGVIVIDD